MKTQVKVIELEANKLVEGGKYIFMLNPQYVEYYSYVNDELDRLIGKENFIIIDLPGDAITVYQIAPEETK